jgi:hypothetical protein
MTNPPLLIGAGIVILALAPFTGGHHGASEPASLVLFVTKFTGCTCTPTLHNVINNVTADCGGNPGTAPTIFVSHSGDNGSNCDQDGSTCVAVANHNCTSTIKAELQWPASPCFSSGSVTGPGIGTADSPCQATNAPNNVSVSWTLVSACTPGGNSTTPDNTFKVWFTPCVGGQPPAGAPAMEYQPRLDCSACTP